MRITLNLASRPFVELRPILARLRIIAGALALLVLLEGLLLHTLGRKAAIADANVLHWTHLTQGLEQEWNQDQTMMREPQNAATLQKTEYLNNLFAQKAFSWTAALMDLENVLPGGVQVVSMQPQMSKDGHVQLRLQVTGERDKAVELVKNLETSKHFLHPRIAGESAVAQTNNGRQGFAPIVSAGSDVNFDILAEYNPKSMGELSSPSTSANASADANTNAANMYAANTNAAVKTDARTGTAAGSMVNANVGRSAAKQGLNNVNGIQNPRGFRNLNAQRQNARSQNSAQFGRGGR